MYAYDRISCTVSDRSQYGTPASGMSDTRRVRRNYVGGCASNKTHSLSVTLDFLIDGGDLSRRRWPHRVVCPTDQARTVRPAGRSDDEFATKIVEQQTKVLGQPRLHILDAPLPFSVTRSAANVSGDLFSLPAGPVAIGVGDVECAEPGKPMLRAAGLGCTSARLH
jgi:hypothetical protein